MELEERLVKLEAENVVQSAVIRALVEMLPPMNSTLDVPLVRAVQQVNNRAQGEEEPLRQALQDALAGLNPMQIPRRRG
jgi:uncharacterized coiled-coil protein SlyX